MYTILSAVPSQVTLNLRDLIITEAEEYTPDIRQYL